MSWLVLRELQRECSLFLKAISLVILELFFSSDFLMVFVIHVKATKNSPPPKSVPYYEVLLWIGPAHPYKALCQSNCNEHFWTFPGIWSHLSSKINHPDDVTSAAGEIPLSPTWQHRWEASPAAGARGFLHSPNKPLAAESQTLGKGGWLLVCKLSLNFNVKCFNILVSRGWSCLLPPAGSLKRMHEEDEELGTMQVAAAQNGWWLRTSTGCSENSCPERWRKLGKNKQDKN